MPEQTANHLTRKRGIYEFVQFTPLLWELIKRDFKAKYKRSYLGILWTVLQPLATTLVIYLIFSTLFNRDIDNFAVYLTSGTIVFGFFAEATTMAMNSLISGRIFFNARLPVYMIPLSRVFSSLLNALLSLIALVIVMVITGLKPTLTVVLFPLPLLYTFLLSFGVGMILSCGMVFFRDLGHLYGIFLTLLRYLTPLFYPESIYPERYLYLFRLNPLNPLVRMFRDVVMYGTVPSVSDHLVCLTYGVAAILIGAMVMRRHRDRITALV